jgi:hypothetical protein
VIVAKLVAATKQAIADNKLPRAMALADRASSLAPDDPTVNEVIDTITEGGRASRRRRIAAIAGIGVIVAGGATFGAMQLLGGSPGGSHAAAAVASLDDAGAAPGRVDAGGVAMTADDAGAVPMIVDAGIAITRVRDAGVASTTRRRDGGLALTPVDATTAVAITPAATPDAAVAVKATGFIVIKNDTWCTVTIDNIGKGTTRADHTLGPFEVDAGGHTVSCEQGGMVKSWTRHVDVAAGTTATAAGSLLGSIQITLDVDATVDGKPYRRGQVATVKTGRVELVVGGKKTWVTVQTPCHVRADGDDVGCY